MRALWQIPLIMAVASLAAAGEPRTLSATYPSSNLHAVVIQAGAGGVEIQAAREPSVQVRVSLTPRRGGIFASLVRAEQEVGEATLEGTTKDGTLHLVVTPKGEDRRFEESWTVRMPADLALALKLGVGDVTLHGVAGGVNLEVGVGDVTVEAAGGDLHVKLGVGDSDLVAPAAAYGPVQASGGIGDATITVGGREIDGTGMVGHSATWQGQGAHKLTVEVGVGDVQVTLK